MTQIGVYGANGRMGKALVESITNDTQANLIGALVRQGSALINIDAGELAGIGKTEVLLSDNDASVIANADVMIDFTLPEALSINIDKCVAAGTAMVIGVTGLDDTLLAKIDRASQEIPIVFSANFSVGINLMGGLLKLTAQVMGDYADIEIFEAHHRFKQDAPSGTALKLGQDIADAMQWQLDQVAVYNRNGEFGERKPKTIGFATLRAGDIVGEHTVTFADIGERLELTHKASSRLTFANGAVRAAKWLKNKPNGLYTMQQVLGLPQIS